MAKTHTEAADFDGIINADALGRFVDRIEILHNERKELNDTIRAIYEECRQAGLDAETVRQMVKERKLDPQIRADQYQIRDAYRRALGLLADTPLGEAAMRREAQAAWRPEDPPPAEWPAPFAEQPVHRRRSRPRKTSQQAIADARAHLEAELAGTA